MTFEPSWTLVVQFLLATIMPLLVGLVTTRVTSGRIKALLLAGLTLITTLLTTLYNGLNGEPVEWFSVIFTTVASFVVSVAIHFGLWKPVGAAQALQELGTKSAS